jgi:hypothetical protein
MTGEREPNWAPLLALAPGEVGDFMWMFAVELESGLRLHAYKHIETRRYLHLDEEGRAFAYIWPEEISDKDEPGSYREVDSQRVLREVLRRRGE